MAKSALFTVEKYFNLCYNTKKNTRGGKEMIGQLELLIKARANLIEMVSYEDKRIQGFVNQVAKNLKMTWYVWNEVNGLSRFDSRSKRFEK